MKKIFNYLASLFLVFGCSDDNNLLEDIAVRGGYIQFEQAPNLSFNILQVEGAVIEAELLDPNNNATSYTLSASLNDKVAEDIVVISSFPATLSLDINEVLSSLGVSAEDLDINSVLQFAATVATPSGTYSGLSPDYNDDNVNEGGNTTVRLKPAELNNAVEFNVTFFLPPAKTIRKTSFEEVPIAASDAVYTRNGGEDETGDLENGASPPYVDYTAQGTTGDDEIGFNSEYVAVTDISSSSLGFSEERIGVYSLLEAYDAYPDGAQGYHMEDIDGMVRINFDTVTVPDGQNQSGISFQAFFGSTTWEELDGMIAYVNVVRDSGSEVIEMVNLFDDDVEAIAGVWQEFNTGFLTGVRSYQLVIEGYNGATPESIDIDNIIVYEPE